jgi:hypothetical protein
VVMFMRDGWMENKDDYVYIDTRWRYRKDLRNGSMIATPYS